MTNKLTFPILTVLFAVLMSIPYLVPHCGAFALIGMVPLLCMEYIATQTEKKRLWVWHYSAFVLWNALTTFWVCNATVGGGIFAVLANALQMSLVFGLFRFSRKRFKGVVPYIFLVVAWIAWERWDLTSADISFPWVVLGNAFARTVSFAQFYEYTGTLGGSLWIWLSNLAIFGTMICFADGSWERFNNKAKSALIVCSAAAIFVPMAISIGIYYGYEEKSEGKLEVLITQPNIDPYNKFSAMNQQQQNAILWDQIESSLKDRSRLSESFDSVASRKPLLVLAPETFTNDVILNDINQSSTFRRFASSLGDYPNVNLLFGASTHEFVDEPMLLSRTLRDGSHYISRNSAIMTDATSRADFYHKSKLVVGVESIPYPKVFVKIDDMLGGVMGRCVGQEKMSLLNCNQYDNLGRVVSSTKIGSIICYESIYGDFCRKYIEEGAKALTIITNDAWWGDTPGYRQHLSYASLRAIETRRDIARSANTGTSAVINQRGDVLEKTGYNVPATIRSEVNLNSEVTWFCQSGDFVGRLCVFLFFILLLALGVRLKTGIQQ
ncbi:MAG: apolipoprotein N-acyltransferase [Bacteroidales bacterium]|nr:apolipoprotein N-acyltransferase [Bacteroidales bacterium]